MTIVGSAFIEISPVADGFAPELRAQVQEAVDGAAPAADELSVAFDGAADRIVAAMEKASADSQVALDRLGLTPVVAELDDKFERLGLSMDQTMADALDVIERDVQRTMTEAGLSADAYAAKFAGAMTETVEANRLANDAMKESNDSEDVSKGFEAISGSAGNLFTKLGNLTGSIPIVGESFKKMGEHLSDAESSGKKVTSVLGDIGKISLVSGAAVAAGIGAESLDLAVKQQSAAASLAASAQISSKAATDIGNAFEDTGFKTVYTGTEMTKAYTGVAAQLATVQGHALDTGQAMQVMAAAGDLAEASGTSLNAATSALGATMQAFQINAAGATGVSNELFVAAAKTGTSVESISSALDRVKTRLGATSPPLSQLSGLLVDMTQHGETGRGAMTALSGAFTAFLKPASDMATAQKNLQIATNDLAPGVAALAAQWNNGAMTAAQVTAAEKTLTTSQLASFQQYQTAVTAVNTASDAYQKLGISVTNSKGQLLPMNQIIGELQKQIEGQSKAQAIATLTADGFGSSAARLVETIQAGPAAYNAATAAVQQQSAAHEAAEKQAKTFEHQVETLKAGLEDEGEKIGTKVIPNLETLGADVMKVVGYFEHHRIAALALAGVIGGALALAVGTFVVLTGVKMVNAVGDAGKSVGNLGKKVLGMSGDTDKSATDVGLATDKMIASFDELLAQVQSTMASIETAVSGAATTISTEMDGALAGAEAAVTELGETMDAVGPEMEVAGAEGGMGMDALLGPIGLLIPLIMLIATHWKEVTKIVTEAAEDAWHFLDDNVIQPVEGAFKAAWDAISSAATTAFHAVENVAKEVFDWLKDNWKTVAEVIISILLPGGIIIAAFIRWHTAIINEIEKLIADIVGFFVNLGNEIVDAIGSLVRIGTKIIADITTGIGSVVAHVVTWFGNVVDDIVTAIGSGVRVGTKIITDITSGIGSLAAHAVSWFGNLVGDILDAVIDINKVGLKIITDIGSGIGDLGGWALKEFGHLASDIISALSGLEKVGEAIINGIVRGIESAGDAIWNAIKKSAGAAGNILGDIGSAGSSVAHFFSKAAQGAEVTEPTIVLVGEGNPSHPEYVIATDPAYRARNLAFLAQAAQRLGVEHQIAGYAMGGILNRPDYLVEGPVDPGALFGSRPYDLNLSAHDELILSPAAVGATHISTSSTSTGGGITLHDGAVRVEFVMQGGSASNADMAKMRAVAVDVVVDAMNRVEAKRRGAVRGRGRI